MGEWESGRIAESENFANVDLRFPDGIPKTQSLNPNPLLELSPSRQRFWNPSGPNTFRTEPAANNTLNHSTDLQHFIYIQVGFYSHFVHHNHHVLGLYQAR